MTPKFNFPIHETKVKGISQTFDLNTPMGRRKYFDAKASKEIEELKSYLDHSTFVGFLLAKKSAGKGTYSKMFQEIFGQDRVELISVGDLVREYYAKITSDKAELKSLTDYFEKYYRGYMSIDDAFKAFLSKSQDKLIPTEFILTLVRKRIEEVNNKAIFLDGFPRDMDQISYSLYFRSIMNLRDDPDFFILIDVPESVIDERMKYRRICPICNTSRNLKLLPTETVHFDKNTNKFELVCDNVSCTGHNKQILVAKEGDENGLELIRARLNKDAELMEKALNLHGVPKILLRNSFPVSEIAKFDDYEVTPEFVYEWDKNAEKVIVTTKPWVIKDDAGVESNSLMAPAVLLSMIKQIHQIVIG